MTKTPQQSLPISVLIPTTVNMPQDDTTVIITVTDPQLGDDVFNTSVPASIRQPGRRKKSTKYGPRDSLKSRLFPGKPGTRRHQRHLNRTFLTDRVDEVEGQDWFVPDTPSFTFFSCEENVRAWETLMNLSEAEQDELFEWFHELSLAEATQPARKYKSAMSGAQAAFNRIDRTARHCMKRQFGSGSYFLSTLDVEILAFANGAETMMTYQLDDSPRRLMCHGICQYYSLISRSVTNKAGVRTTFIYKPKEHTIPTISLLEFMATF